VCQSDVVRECVIVFLGTQKERERGRWDEAGRGGASEGETGRRRERRVNEGEIVRGREGVMEGVMGVRGRDGAWEETCCEGRTDASREGGKGEGEEKR